MASHCVFVCCPICTWSASSAASTVEQTVAAIRRTMVRHLLGDHGLSEVEAQNTALALSRRAALIGAS